MKKLPVQMEIVSGDGTVKTETAQFQILPPPPGCCAVCGVKHDPREPHMQSLYYQYAFHGEHGRWPTWADAIAHCSPEMQTAWKAELAARKYWTFPPDGSAPIAQPYAMQQ